jgi:hypothetical protein
LRATEDTSVAGSRVGAGESLAARWADRATLAHAVSESAAQKASGVVYFRLPDGSASGGWSLLQHRHLDQVASPQLVLERTSDSKMCLTNRSEFDLPPRLVGNNGDRDRGYALEIEADAPVWREAVAGDFWRVAAHADAEKNPSAVPIELSTRLTFWFSGLQAGQQLTSGLVQTSAGAARTGIRYRILNVPDAKTWRDLE